MVMVKLEKVQGYGNLKKRMKKLGDPLFPVPIVVSLIIWEAMTSWTGLIQPLFLPSFSSVLAMLFSALSKGELLLHIYSSLYRIAASFLVSTAIGIALGWMIGWYKLFGRLTWPLVYILYPLPKIAFIGLFMIWFGLGDTTTVVQATFGSLFSVLLNTIVGIQTIDPVLIRAARDYGANDMQIATKVAFPAALPVIFAGVKLGLGVAFIVTMSAEMIISPGRYGLGIIIAESGMVLDTTRVFVAITTLSVLALAIFKGIDYLERVLIPWAPSKS